jgi:hypothetical protein
MAFPVQLTNQVQVGSVEITSITMGRLNVTSTIWMERCAYRHCLTAMVSYTRKSFLKELTWIINDKSEYNIVYDEQPCRISQMSGQWISGCYSMMVLQHISPSLLSRNETWYCCATTVTILSIHCHVWHFPFTRIKKTLHDHHSTAQRTSIAPQQKVFAWLNGMHSRTTSKTSMPAGRGARQFL